MHLRLFTVCVATSLLMPSLRVLARRAIFVGFLLQQPQLVVQPRYQTSTTYSLSMTKAHLVLLDAAILPITVHFPIGKPLFHKTQARLV